VAPLGGGVIPKPRQMTEHLAGLFKSAPTRSGADLKPAVRRFPRVSPGKNKVPLDLIKLLNAVLERLSGAGIMPFMRKDDVICSECNAGFRRIEFASRSGEAGKFRCPLCNHVLEVFDGSSEVAYRLTVAPEKLFE